MSRIFAPEPAAAAYALESYARAFVEDGWDVRVITSTYRDSPHRERTVAGEVRRMPVLRNAAGYVRGYFSYLSFDVPLAFRLLVAPRADLIFVEPPPTTGAVVRVLAALRRVPVLYDAADLWSDAAVTTTDSRLVLRALRALERFAMRGADRAVVVAEGYAVRMRELGIATPTTVVGFGADTRSFGYTPSSVVPVFVYAGSYSEWHGAHIFVEAFADVLRRAPQARLQFIGNGSERPRLETLAADLGLTAAVEFRDPIPGAELAIVLGGATASLASLEPGLGYDYAFATKVYSSLAAGCPVVFAGAGPAGPYIDVANEHVRAGEAVGFDAAAVASAMLRALEDPVGPAERAAIADWMRRHHSLDAVGSRVVAAARQVVGP